MTCYSKAIIYTIRTDDGLYVGSTCDFKDRKRQHKSSIYNENSHNYNYKLYKNIRANDGEYLIELYKPFSCENVIELRQEEDRIMIELDANLNMVRAYNSEEHKKIYFQQRYENNKDELNAKQKVYNEKHKDEIRVKKKLYRENNKVVLRAKQLEKITCECGCDISRSNIRVHQTTKKHLNRMKELDDLQSPV